MQQGFENCQKVRPSEMTRSRNGDALSGMYSRSVLQGFSFSQCTAIHHEMSARHTGICTEALMSKEGRRESVTCHQHSSDIKRQKDITSLREQV